MVTAAGVFGPPRGIAGHRCTSMRRTGPTKNATRVGLKTPALRASVRAARHAGETGGRLPCSIRGFLRCVIDASCEPLNRFLAFRSGNVGRRDSRRPWVDRAHVTESRVFQMRLLLISTAVAVVLVVIAMAVFVFVIQDVEQPDYQVVSRDGPFEVRDYPGMIVAETTIRDGRQDALSEGFRRLAGYIFARDRQGDRIAMTAPVQQQAQDPATPIPMTAPVTQQGDDAGGWQVRFIMPSRYTLDELPSPGREDLVLRELPPMRVASIRFDGRPDDAALASREEELRAWISRRGLTPRGQATHAFYNDPFTPGFLRRNEVQIALAPDGAGQAR